MGGSLCGWVVHVEPSGLCAALMCVMSAPHTHNIYFQRTHLHTHSRTHANTHVVFVKPHTRGKLVHNIRPCVLMSEPMIEARKLFFYRACDALYVLCVCVFGCPFAVYVHMFILFAGDDEWGDGGETCMYVYVNTHIYRSNCARWLGWMNFACARASLYNVRLWV